jgi:hypothetical protein
MLRTIAAPETTKAGRRDRSAGSAKAVAALAVQGSSVAEQVPEPNLGSGASWDFGRILINAGRSGERDSSGLQIGRGSMRGLEPENDGAQPVARKSYERIPPVVAPIKRHGKAGFNFANVSVMAPVQRRVAAGGSGSPQGVSAGEVHLAADLGTSGAGEQLPHQTEIQRSFGRHNLSDIRAHTDPAARAGARGMRAQAFTRGSDVAFGESPSLHLAAHEAAHVIQQRAGLQLRDGLGQRGDRYEQHAEAVAQLVLDGRSAESLLNAYASPSADRGIRGSVQRFESEEHQHLGDVATGSKTYNVADAVKNPGDKFELTHGDILALSGDVFPPDELFRLAAIPGDHGKLAGTRDEVIWGLRDPGIWEMRSGKTGPGPYTGKNDPRFEKGGIWENFVFSDDVKNAVTQRYLMLAAQNASHFGSPLGRDKKGNPIPTKDSAGSTYRGLHESAIKEAYKLGALGDVIDMGMAREAAAQHFLTDSFAAGHLRTPIASIRTYWGDKYPLFWYNLRHKIALDTAIEMTKGTVIPNNTGYTQILSSVEAMAPTLPAITLGDLLAKVFHDVDNEQGVAIKGGGKVMGDAHLDTATETLAVAAIQAGNKDIEAAYNLGVQTKLPMPDADLFAKVRPANGGTKDKYAPELQIPVPDKNEPPQNWKAPDISSLWTKNLLGQTGDTVGMAISKTVRTGAIAGQLTDLADKFPADAMFGKLHPRAAYLTGFVANLQSDPRAGVMDIVTWAPHDMLTGSAPREVVQDLMNKGAAGDKKENLGNMRMDQRVKIVNDLISDGGPGVVLNPNGNPADLDMIFKVFESLNHAGRLELYKNVEGHPWQGDFQRTWGSRDELFKAMEKTGNDVARLKRLLNAK